MPTAHGDSAFESVLTAAQADAGWAYRRLHAELAGPVFGYFRMQGCGTADAEDLTSEVFLHAFSGIGSFQGGQAQFRSWIFTIAHRRLSDERRRWSRRPLAGSGHDLGEVPSPEAAVEDVALGHLGDERVRALCQALSADQRDVLLLRLLSGMTIDEIASMVGKSQGAVKALQRRGLGTLRKILDREGVPL